MCQTGHPGLILVSSPFLERFMINYAVMPHLLEHFWYHLSMPQIWSVFKSVDDVLSIWMISRLKCSQGAVNRFVRARDGIPVKNVSDGIFVILEVGGCPSRRITASDFHRTFKGRVKRLN